jgi:hypothetical protein
MKFTLLTGVIALFLISLVGASTSIDTTTIMNTSVSNSSVSFSIEITGDIIIIETTYVNITNATYNLGGLRSCNIYWDTENNNLDSADFGCSLIGDITPPTFDNLRNFTHPVNTSFSQSITASDDSGIDSYWLNQTDYFNIDKTTGLITNVTNLSRVEIHYLIIFVNDTLNNIANGTFWINVTIPSEANVTIISVASCKYKKLVYYNLNRVWYRDENCI